MPSDLVRHIDNTVEIPTGMSDQHIQADKRSVVIVAAGDDNREIDISNSANR